MKILDVKWLRYVVVYFNLDNYIYYRENNTKFEPTYEISDLLELKSIL